MHQFIKKIYHFCLSNTSWIYLTLFLFFSHLLHVSMVKETWGNYLFYFLAISGLYFPILAYAFFRKRIVRQLSRGLNGILWGYCFLVHPVLVHLLRNYYFENLFPFDNFMYGTEDVASFRIAFGYTIGLSILATEIGIQLNGNLRNWWVKKQWSQRLGLDQLLLVLMVTWSVFFGLATNFNMIGSFEGQGTSNIFLILWRLLYYGSQSFLILLVYYSFYYVNKHYLIPQFLSKKGVVYYGFSMVLVILLAYPILTQYMRLFPLHQLMVENSYFTQPFHRDRGLFPGLIMILSVPVVVALQWFEQNSQIVNLEKEKSATELNLLKQQINPHFFFNTLNNLYALSIVKDRQTPEVILQLSELMRYVIYKGKQDTVALKEEVKYIEDYIQLQQIRLHKNLDFQFTKNIDNEDVAIPPLLFITFVENAFKHGIEPAENDCFLHLQLKSNAQQLMFICKNSFEEKNAEPPGIGLENLQRRMALRFPDTHQINYVETKNTFTATLTVSYEGLSYKNRIVA